MSQIARIELRHATGVVAARERVRVLAEELGFGPVRATTVAVAASELCRAASSSAGAWFEIELGSPPPWCSGLAATVAICRWGPRVDPETSVEWGDAFDCVHRHSVSSQTGGCGLEAVLVPVRQNGVAVEEVAEEVVKRFDRELVPSRAELEAARAAAEESTRLKAQFLANMSHEIRTPLNGILGMTQLLAETELTAEQVDYVRALRHSGETLLALINDILDFSKIEAQRLELEPAEFRLRDALGEMLEPLAAKAYEKGLELIQDVAPDVPDVLVGDAFRLQQVLLNLVGNAIKFTERGEVVVRVERARAEDDEDSGSDAPITLRFAVADTGPGIPPEARERVFEAFAQADASTTRRFGGTGLGLSISSRLVSLMGGRIWLESAVGSGSTFSFEIRLTAAAGAASPHRAAIDLSGARAVVASPNEAVRELLRRTLGQWRVDTRLASTAGETLQQVDAWATSGQPPIAIVDAGLDGAGALEAELAERRGSREELRTVVLVYPSQLEDVRRCRDSGLAWVFKPVRPSALFAALTEDGLARPRQRAEPSPELPRLEILVAEDNAVNQKVVRAMLEQAGQLVTVANDGVEALELLAEREFDLVLMDVQMPRMGGFEATRRLRQREAEAGTRRTPVIALTAHAMAGDREECLAAGMDEYVTKPIIREALLEALRGIEPRDRTGDEAMHDDRTDDDAARGASNDEAPGSPAPVDRDVLDLDEALERLGGDRELFGEVAGMLLDEMPQWVEALEAALASGEREPVVREAHKIKGAVGNLSAHAAQRAALELEMAARDPAGGELDPLFRKLRAELDRAAKAVRSACR